MKNNTSKVRKQLRLRKKAVKDRSFNIRKAIIFLFAIITFLATVYVIFVTKFPENGVTQVIEVSYWILYL